MTFAFYPEEAAWWSFADYGAVLSVVRRIQPATVLEFGPGSSTLALVEGGAAEIDTCEDAPDWAAVYRERLQGRFPSVVRLVEYTWSDPLSIPACDGRRYDMALIDGPYTTPKRPPAIAYALARCKYVMVCNEDYKARGLRADVRALAGDRRIEIIESGPLAGSFSLVYPC